MALDPKTGAVRVYLTNSIDTTNDWQKVSIENDDVGLAKDATLQTTNTTLQSIDSKITTCNTDNVTISNFPTDYPLPTTQVSDLKLITIDGDNVGLATEATLSGIKTQTDKLSFDSLGLKVSTYSDKVVTQQLSSATINAGSSQSVTVTVPAGKTGVAITVRATYNASATAGGTLNVYYSPDGTNYDTDTDDSYVLPFSAGATKQKTYIISAVTPYLKIEIVNNDSTYAMTVDVWTTFF